jgi:hypothetical protein
VYASTSFPCWPHPIIGALKFNKLLLGNPVSVSHNCAHVAIEDAKDIKATNYTAFKLVRVGIVKLASALAETLLNRQIIEEQDPLILTFQFVKKPKEKFVPGSKWVGLGHTIPIKPRVDAHKNIREYPRRDQLEVVDR